MTDREEYLVEFVRFLDSLGIVKEYFANLDGRVPVYKSGLLLDAFYRHRTEQGEYFWDKVNYFWLAGMRCCDNG